MDTADIYEKLRAAVLSAQPTASPGLAILRRRGLAAWIRTLGQEPHAGTACGDHQPPPSAKPDPSPPASDITRLIAGIIVALALETRQILVELAPKYLDLRLAILNLCLKLKKKSVIEWPHQLIDAGRLPRSFEALAESLERRAFEIQGESRT